MTNPDIILWAEVVKGLYYPNAEFLNAKVGSRASWGWRSILAGRDILCKGLRKQIANGYNTNIWNDPRLPTLPTYKIMSHKPKYFNKYGG